MAVKRALMRPALKTLAWALGIIVLLLLTVFAGSFFIDKPLRGYMEKTVNRHLKGYTATLQGAHFQPLDFALTLKGVTITQDANPSPPVADLPVFKASLNWRSLIHGRIVGELYLDRPRLHVDLGQLRHEKAQRFPVKQEGWQRAFEAIYPLKINRIAIEDGDITYIDADPRKPLHIARLNALGENIRNIVSPDKPYPSPLHLDGVIFEKGRLAVDGSANFLEEPFVGVKAAYNISGVPLENLGPVLARKNMHLEGGVIASQGDLEYSPKIKVAHVKDLEISGVRLDYMHSPETAAAEKARLEKVKAAAKEVRNRPGVLVLVDRLRVEDSEFGYVNETKNPSYRAFLTDVKLVVTNLSNHLTRGTADISLYGKFMGSGRTTATATFRPEKRGADFDLKFAVDDAELRPMNDILLAYGNFDVEGGQFSLYADVHIKDGRISGYIKPFFKDIDVYDKRKEKDRSLFHKLYVRIIGLVATILENPGQDTVATKITISGTVEKPKTSTWQVIKNLIKHAFFHAFLPEFDKAVSKKSPGAGKTSQDKPGSPEKPVDGNRPPP